MAGPPPWPSKEFEEQVGLSLLPSRPSSRSKPFLSLAPLPPEPAWGPRTSDFPAHHLGLPMYTALQQPGGKGCTWVFGQVRGGGVLEGRLK